MGGDRAGRYHVFDVGHAGRGGDGADSDANAHSERRGVMIDNVSRETLVVDNEYPRGNSLGDCCAQLDALRAVLDEAYYNIRQLRTVLRLKEIENAEQSNAIEHLRKRVLELQPALYPDHLFKEVGRG